jgi:two-component system, OmpR family, sensor histidine kinase ChvG
MKLPRLGLQGKLAIAALPLLALPWVGWLYVQEMERFMLDAQEQALMGTARALATALHNRPRLLFEETRLDSDLKRLAEEELKLLAAERNQASTSGQKGAEVPADSARAAPLPVANPAEEIGAILKGLERTTSRIWVVNREYRVLTLAGSLKRPQRTANEDTWVENITHTLLSGLISRPSEDFDEASPEDVLASGREVSSALQGAPRSRVRQTSDRKATIMSAAYPIWANDEIVGAVVVEESTNSILAVRSRALERLLLATLAAFVLAGAVLLGLATQLSWRIRRLRDEAEGAIDAQGHITRLVSGSGSRDEIGDLSRSFSSLVERLADHHAYLEAMASRLSHELRTPIAVVRSSLENLKLDPSREEARVYLARAEEGLSRLATILTRMSEASRLEQSLSTTEREKFDLVPVLRGCVEGYRSAFSQRAFELSLPDSPLVVEGSPDLMVQLLDKLTENALDFATPGTPIAISLAPAEGSAMFVVANRGEPLPEGMRDRLFASMVSVRKDAGGAKPHLGMGLYVARLITEFHRGTVRADNLPSGGVAVTVRLPLG